MQRSIAETFIDNAGRTIGVSLGGDIVAYHDGAEVGRFQMIHDGLKHCVDLADVARDYRRAGIGLNMLRIASSRWGKLTVENWRDGPEVGPNPLMPAGRALMTKAVRLGYVWPEEPLEEEPVEVDVHLGRD